MTQPFEWPLADKLVRNRPADPILTVVFPTWNRSKELAVAVESFTSQLAGGLEEKVEIIISDNASDNPATLQTVKALAEAHPNISYYVHAVNGGGPAQICVAPWRARGRWTWVFGDDDLLLPGGLAHVVERLETDRPAFLTLNRRVMDKTLTRIIQPAKHALPDQRYANFVELLRGIGVDQVSFYSSQIYLTEAARRIDCTIYTSYLCHYIHVGYYLAGYHDLSGYYDNSTYVVHRWDPGATNTHNSNFYHLGAALPVIMAAVRDLCGLPKTLFEEISGEKRVTNPHGFRLSFVDMVLQNLWRCVASGWPITETEWDFLAGECQHWKPERRPQFETLRALAQALDTGMAQLEGLAAQTHDDPAAAHRVAQFLGETLLQGRAKAHEMSMAYE